MGVARLALCAVLVALPATAAAKPATPVVIKHAPRTRIDWSRGLILATAGQAADVRAPRPGIARIAAEREARARAKAIAAEAAKAIHLATGKTVGDAAKSDPDAAARLARAAQSARDVDISYATDGSVTITVGLALEAVRRAVMGTPEAQPAAADAPTAVIVDARKVLRKPRLGIAIAHGDETYRGPVVFYRRGLELADDRLGPRVAIAPAARYHHGTLIITKPLRAHKKQAHASALSLAAAAQQGAVVVVILGEKR